MLNAAHAISDTFAAKKASCVGLQDPEAFVDDPLGKEVDIWAFGRLIFEFIVGDTTFPVIPEEGSGLTETEHFLLQTILYSGEQFSDEQLHCNPRTKELLELIKTKYDFSNDQTVFGFNFEKHLMASNSIKNSVDVKETARLIRRCLKLRPCDRPTAEELLKDPWFDGAE
ncbi:hypothetical protein AX16_010031 [Volvariella volvacea WC 439]|nr:hypothetical protein AX16_010031 [Volvariella volvacea WC 439]